MTSLSNRHARVLCIGRDPSLLRTRQLVLANHFNVVTVGTVGEMQALGQDRNFDVVLLCHSLSAEECDLAAVTARRRWPAARILALAVERSSCRHYAEQTIRGLDGPRLLIQAIEHLVGAER
jgi:DNA-binding response OmpR family regulator